MWRRWLLVLAMFGASVGVGTLTGVLAAPPPSTLFATDSATSGPAGPVQASAAQLPPPSGSPDVLAIPPKGPPESQRQAYLAPKLPSPLRNLDPSLALRGPRPTLHTLQSVYQYGDPTVMFGPAGGSDWRLSRPDPGAVRGYASEISALPGATLDLYLAGRDPTTTLDVFRVGIDDARRVLHVDNVAIPLVAEAAPRPGDGLVVERWPVATTLVVGRDWSSGVYLIKLTGSSGGESYILFLVRPPVPGAFTVVIPTMTYEAYNQYGGADLYGWPTSPTHRAYQVSYDRPFDDQFGAGLFFRLDFPLVVWLEDHGYTPDYIADVDIAGDPTILQGVRTLAFSGHGEYWTAGMRNSVEAAAARGTNLAFFGANQAFWQSRLIADPAGTANRVVVCYKSAPLDPVTASDPAASTVRFQDPPVRRPPATLIGQKYGGIVTGVTPMRIGPGIDTFAPGIGLREGQLLPGLIGEEVDELHPAFHGLALGQTPLTVVEHPGQILVGMTVWISPAGNRVFDAGTFDYSWGLDPRYSSALPGFDATAFEELTARILAWLGAFPTR